MRILLSVLLVISIVSCTKEIPESERQNARSIHENAIRETITNYYKALNNNDLESAVSFIDDDYREVISDSTDIAGIDGLFESLEKYRDNYTEGKWSFTIIEIIVSGEFGYLRTEASFEKYDPIEKKNAPVYSEKSFRILKKQKDDGWKFLRCLSIESFSYDNKVL